MHSALHQFLVGAQQFPVFGDSLALGRREFRDVNGIEEIIPFSDALFHLAAPGHHLLIAFRVFCAHAFHALFGGLAGDVAVALTSFRALGLVLAGGIAVIQRFAEGGDHFVFHGDVFEQPLLGFIFRQLGSLGQGIQFFLHGLDIQLQGLGFGNGLVPRSAQSLTLLLQAAVVKVKKQGCRC